MKSKHIEILDIIAILLKYKKMIIFPTLIVSLIAVVYIMLVPKYWVSTAKFMPLQEQRATMPLAGSQLLGMGLSMLGPQIQVNALEMIAIINSRTFSENVVRKFDLIAYFEIEDEDERVEMEEAVEALNKKVKDVNLDRETGIITLNTETKDKHLSADIANYYIELLDRHNLENRMTKGRQKREFIEERLTNVKAKIDSIANEINKFQKQHNVIDLELQAMNLVDLYSDIISEQVTTEIELDFNRQFIEPSSPMIAKLEAKNQLLKQRIADLEHVDKREEKLFVLNLKDLPDLGLQYMELELTMEIQTKIYEYLYPIYEEARIDEIKDLPTIEVLDQAIPAGLRSKPSRARFCIITFLITIVTLSIAAIVVERIKMLDNEENKPKIDEIKKYLKF
jgi:uncharacterized protein involved in exopolysaccharide biosynthesis